MSDGNDSAANGRHTNALRVSMVMSLLEAANKLIVLHQRGLVVAGVLSAEDGATLSDGIEKIEKALQSMNDWWAADERSQPRLPPVTASEIEILRAHLYTLEGIFAQLEEKLPVPCDAPTRPGLVDHRAVVGDVAPRHVPNSSFPGKRP